jgi:mitochondrial Rho GTPase 1
MDARVYSCCSVEDSDRVSEELLRADSVILTYACDRPNTLQNLSTFWLPLLRKLEVVISLFLVFASQVFYI